MGTEQNSYLFPEFRKREILKIIGERGLAQIPELAEICGVSAATIRRDLNELHRDGAIRRTHGGAVLQESGSIEQLHRKKLELMKAEKTRIAQAAVQQISDGESIFLDSGTTTLMIATLLEPFQNLTVITNNTDIIQSIKLHPSSQLVVTGGIMRAGYSVLAGPAAESFLATLKIDKVFIGADSVDIRDGLYSSSFMEVALKQLSVHSGRTRYLVTDSTKFYIKGIVKICDLSEFDYIITDDGLNAKSRSILREQKVEMIIV